MMNIPAVSGWTVSFNFVGVPQLEFACPSCGTHLTAGVKEAGKPESCPECERGYLLPKEAAEEAKTLIAKRKQDKQEQRARARQAKEEERREKAEQKQALELERAREEQARQQREEADRQALIKARPTEKQCPYCLGTIAFDAKKCQHCGEFLVKQSVEESVLWEGHPSHWYYLKWHLLGVICLPLLGFGLFFIAYALIHRWTCHYRFTSQRLVAKWGILSRTTKEVAVRDIRSIDMHQGIIERLFGLGTILIGSAGTGGIDLIFAGIVNPVHIRDSIRQVKDASS